MTGEKPLDARGLLLQCEAFCRSRGTEVSRLELYLLIEAFAGIPRARFPLEQGREIPREKREKVLDALSRRCKGEPLQYLLGQWSFYGREFRVGPGVLIPRADTETLAEHALEYLKGRPSPQAADLCAGSGCIGITLALERADSRVRLLELSGQAFAYLTENIRRLGAENCFALREDVLAPRSLPQGLDLIVANPPYIPTGELASLQREVRREPPMALDGDADGLRFYRGIPPLWRGALRPGGMLAFEIGRGQKEAVAKLLCESGYEQICFRKDLAGIIRVVSAIRPAGERGEGTA